MSVTMITRPAQTLRRRDTSRPTISMKRGLSVDITGENPSKKRRLEEPYVRDSQYILRKHKGKAPSLVVHLHTTHFRFDGQDGSFTYDGPMRILIKHLRAQTVPHDLLEELLSSNIPFYDGCLIVEVHNHRDLESKKNGSETQKSDDTKKQSMHNWNAHITPSPYVPYPNEAQIESDSPQDEASSDKKDDKNKQGDEGPKVTTIVLHPTEQTRHEELLLLAKTPASEVSKKKGADGATASTPSTAGPTNSTSTTPRSTSNKPAKMALEQDDLYSFQAETLVATEPPLYLEPAEDAAQADAILKMLEHPLHSGRPPASKSRKKTTAQMAADDAQAAETERRMLMFDERLGLSARNGASANNSDNQTAALGFSRFKTIEMVRQKQAEAERIKKEDEARLAQEKRQQEEQLQQQKLLAAQKKAQENNFQEQRRQAMLRQQQEAVKLNGQYNGIIPNHLQGMTNGQNFAGSQNQASPIVAQQTPHMPHTSPMTAQNGFATMPTAVQQSAGSPPRPPSAAIPNGVGMMRGPSQSHSVTGTPLMNQGGTPSLANAVPNRAMSQTPRLGPSSPMTGTPAASVMQTPRMNSNLSTTQDIMLLQQQQQQQQHLMNAQNAPQGAQPGNIDPAGVTFARNMARYSELSKRFVAQANVAMSRNQPQMAQQFMANAKAAQAQYAQMRQKLLAGGHGTSQGQLQGQAQASMMGQVQQNGMQNGMMSQGGMNPQMQAQQANANLLTQQQQALARQQQQAVHAQQLALANQQLTSIAQQHGGNIPPHIAQSLPPMLQHALRQRRAQMQAQQARNMAQAQGMQMNGQGSPPNGAASYMQNLQALQMQTMQRQGQQPSGMNAMNMNMGNMQQYAQQQQQRQQAQLRQQQSGNDLNQSFAEMQAALQRGHGQ